MRPKLVRKIGAIIALFCATSGHSLPAHAQSYSVPPALQAKIDSHPNVRKLTDWGSRADWSADSRRLLFVSKEYGDLFELNLASGKTRPLSFHFSHDGIFRAYYLANGDYLLTAARDHMPGKDLYGRFFESELWLLKRDLSGPPVPLNERNLEGVAVARSGMKIAWAKPMGPKPPRESAKSEMKNSVDMGQPNQIWIGDVTADASAASLTNKRLLLDCAAATGPLATVLAREGGRCVMLEPQNFVPRNDDRLTFSMLTANPQKGGFIEFRTYVLDLKTNIVTNMIKQPGYAKVEGIFPDGKSTLIEHAAGTVTGGAAHKVDLWRLALDGTGRTDRVTHYNLLDPQLKCNQGVVSPDGRWLAFGVSTSEIEDKVFGQGLGIFLMDLKAAGF